MSFILPFPENSFGVKGSQAFGVINTWNVTKTMQTPAANAAPEAKKVVYNVRASVVIYFDEEAYHKKQQPLKSEDKTVVFDSNPTEEALIREVHLLYNPE